MYQYPCPHCQAPIAISPAKAGGELVCDQCNQTIAVPKLGELRQLPTTDRVADVTPAHGSRSIGYLALSLIGAGCLLVASYCGIRWSLIDASVTTQTHLEQLRVGYEKASSAELVREWEDINKFGIDLPFPYRYRTTELQKQGWGRNALIFSAAGLAAIGIALATQRSARKTD